MYLRGKMEVKHPCLLDEQSSTGHAFCAITGFQKAIWIHEAYDFEQSAFSDHEANTRLGTTVLALFLGLLLVQKLIGLLGRFPSELL